MTRAARLRTVSALGIIEIFAWGTSFYLIAVLAGPIGAETGWSGAAISAGVSLGLLVSGLFASLVGRRIERHGGRPVLAVGMVLLACGLGLLGLSRSLPAYYLAWAIMGAGMSCGLYDAAFSTLGRIFGRDARSAITQLTLWGGFASTVCWPLSAWLVEAVGWRSACFAYAGFHLVVTLPLALLAIPRAEPPPRGVPRRPLPVAAAVPVTDMRFLCLATAGVVLAMLSTIWSVHFVSILTATGYGVPAAIAIGTLIGPAQVAARVLEMMGRGRHHPVWTMLASTSAVVAGFSGLLFGLPAALAMIAWGAGNGLWSIARGALPLSVFGSEGYARTMGRLATPVLISSAAAPSIGALMKDVLTADAMLGVMATASIIPLAMALVLLRHKRPVLAV
ncbi:MFS transporter [Pseudoroseicyclus tamaricis]|uniref:MFS transporter n=1 Tax=Pseudoroseicyclus tamaricis TaxID=2705421 RepID=A0A6B2JPW4_9RHOB|nr:MFS transporter [Pseudoroseicyclus tamaricis]NDV00005.1 MFS transporter [Pseudoroseicyclus tamaricis]